MARVHQRTTSTRDNSILTDNAQTYAVMLLTGHPEHFVDRVDQQRRPVEGSGPRPRRSTSTTC